MPSDRSKKKSAAKAKGPKSKVKRDDGEQIEEEGSGAEEIADGVKSLSLEAPSSSAAATPASKSGSGGGAASKASSGMAAEKTAAVGLAPAGPSPDSGRSCTGILASHPQSRDIHIESLTLLNFGCMLLEDASLELNFGRWVVLRLDSWGL